MSYKNKSFLILASSFLFLTGCVTINVYFPAAAAEKAADKLIEEIWQLKQLQQQPKKSEAK